MLPNARRSLPNFRIASSRCAVVAPRKSSRRKQLQSQKHRSSRRRHELPDNLNCLFVFVEYPEVEPTNNRSERNARREAEIRKGARTNKTDRGAKRRSIVVTVLASLRTRITRFTLSNMLAEVGRWLDTGKSLFELELEAIREKTAPPNQPEPI